MKIALATVSTALLAMMVFTFSKVEAEKQLPESSGGMQEEVAGLLNEPILPIPRGVKLNTAKVELGRRLFHDTMLSRDNTVACATCHNLAQGGDDGRRFSIGIDGRSGSVNAPTVFNSALNFKQFWDGRAKSLEDQVNGPLGSEMEMGSTWESVLTKLRAHPEYAGTFASIYTADGITDTNVRDAIATFERSLLTPNARFDAYLRGASDAITAEEREGYELFKQLGCITCHQGMAVGGNMFQPFGVLSDAFLKRGTRTDADNGRFNVTGLESDRHRFKVPSLRNVDKTAPYFHDGSAETLDDAVRVMGRYQLGTELKEVQIRRIVQFLKTLTGEYEGKPL